MASDIKFSIIMPSLNEEQNISSAILNSLEALDQFEVSGELIVINDGSTDNTGALIKSYMSRDARVRMITHPRPLGVGASFWDGVNQARGEFVVMIPGDNEVDATEILRYHSLLANVDIVIPFVFNKQVRPLFRIALSFIYQFIINTTFFVNFNYTNGTVLYRKSLLQELEFRSSSFFFQTDILVRLAKSGYLYAEVPYCLGLRSHGVSKSVSLHSLLMVIQGYFRLLLDIYGPSQRKETRSPMASSRTAQRYLECEDLYRGDARFKS